MKNTKEYEALQKEITKSEKKLETAKALLESKRKELQKLCSHDDVHCIGYNMHSKDVRECRSCGLKEGLGRDKDEFEILTRLA